MSAGRPELRVVVDSPDPAAVAPFWQQVLGYEPSPDGLVDPLRRDPAIVLRRSEDHRPLRNRLHLDVVRPAPVVQQVAPGEGGGPYAVRHADADGNEVDLVPGDPLGSTPETADWQVVFAAMACYRTTSTAQQDELASAARALAADVGFPLVVDVRPGLVVLDSGKDMADRDAHGLDLDFADLAARLQSVARDLGATADPALPRFVQLFLDAADIPAVQAFWMAALGHVEDRRDGIPDIYDPQRVLPVMGFQPLDPADTARREQRDRLHVELALSADVARQRADAAVAAGGRLLDESGGRWHLADPERNELVLLA